MSEIGNQPEQSVSLENSDAVKDSPNLGNDEPKFPKDSENSAKPALEQEAAAKGWVPDGPKSAEEFLRAEPLYKEIKASHKEIKELKTAINNMKSLMDKQQQKAYQQALTDIKKAKDEAITLGDVHQVSVLDQQLYDMQKEIQQVSPVQMTEKVQDFIQRNDGWLKEQSDEASDMRLLAEAKYLTLKQQGRSDDEIVDVINVALKRAFPQRFERSKSSSVVAVEQQSVDALPTKKNPSSYTFNDLNAQQKEICRSLEKAKIMSAKQYIDELRNLGELK